MAATYEPIATYTLASTNTDICTFTSIPGTYTDLIIIIKSNGAGIDTDTALQFNADGTSTYSWTNLSGSGSSSGSSKASNQSSLYIDSTGVAVNGVWGMNITHIMNYSNTTTYKTTLTRASSAGQGVDGMVGLWRNTSAITSIKVFSPQGRSFAVGTTATLYGIKAA